MERINKAAFLQGKKYTEKFEVPEMNGYFLIRPLDDIEASMVENIVLSSLKPGEYQQVMEGRNNRADFNIFSVMSKETLDKVMIGIMIDSKYRICAAGIVDENGDPEYTEEEIKYFPAGLPARIAARIQAISGMSEEAEKMVDNFR